MRIFSSTKLNIISVFVSSIISIALFVLVFEIIENIRYYNWRADFNNHGWFGRITRPSTNPILMWEYRPYGEFGLIKTNRYGFRDFDYESVAKPDYSLRIAFVGDSVTLGLGVSGDETFVHQFEIEVNKADARQTFQALNFGVDGYNTPQIYETIRTKVLPLSPDKVFYMLCLNDFDFSESSGHKIRYFRKPKSFFLLRMERLYLKLSGVDFHLYYFQKNKEAVYQSIQDMRKLLERVGVSFRVVILPAFFESESDFEYYPLRPMHQQIRDYLTKNDIPYFDLLDAFSQQRESPRHYALNIWHPNPEGHRFISKQLVPLVLSE